MRKPQACILAAMWGQTYTDFFVRVSGPALLANGNLPALAAMCTCELVILTRAADTETILESPALQRIRRLMPVKCTAIDDLIVPGNMGYTLTHAYARGLGARGEAALDTWFIFMNADFVFADGSLGNLGQRIVNGCHVVMAPSLRGIREKIFPVLDRSVDRKTGVLALSPREAVGLTLQALHPTVIANTVEQPFYHSTVTNKFFWRVDATTLVAHFFLLFMLCIRPTRRMTAVTGFCDYTFVPELCPGAPIDMIDNSDDGFILEMQGGVHELENIIPGKAGTPDIARQLSEWTTREHRYCARQPVIFHTGDIGDAAAPVLEAAARYMDGIHRCLAPEPQATRRHPYWQGALAMVRRTGSDRQAGLETAVSGHDRHGRSGPDRPVPWHNRVAPRLYDRLAGIPPHTTLLHPFRVEHRAVSAALESMVVRAAGPDSAAYITPGAEIFDRFVRQDSGQWIQVAMDDLNNGHADDRIARRCRSAFLSLPVARVAALREALVRVSRLLPHGAPVVVLLHNHCASPGDTGFVRRFVLEAGDLFAPGLAIERVRYPGGFWLTLLRTAIHRHATRFSHIRRRPDIRALLALAGLFPLLCLANLLEGLRDTRKPRPDPAAMLITARVSRPAAATGSTSGGATPPPRSHAASGPAGRRVPAGP